MHTLSGSAHHYVLYIGRLMAPVCTLQGVPDGLHRRPCANPSILRVSLSPGARWADRLQGLTRSRRSYAYFSETSPERVNPVRIWILLLQGACFDTLDTCWGAIVSMAAGIACFLSLYTHVKNANVLCFVPFVKRQSNPAACCSEGRRITRS